jgi:hypothetical protein
MWSEYPVRGAFHSDVTTCVSAFYYGFLCMSQAQEKRSRLWCCIVASLGIQLGPLCVCTVFFSSHPVPSLSLAAAIRRISVTEHSKFSPVGVGKAYQPAILAHFELA